MNIFAIIGFITVVVLHLLGESILIKGRDVGMNIRYISKPLLMPLLLTLYLTGIDDPSIWVIFAVVGGWIGDICLMIPDPKETKKFFRIGLIAFLLGHIFYIIAILQLITISEWWYYLLSLPFIIYGVVVYKQLVPHTGKMRVPVTIYIIVILVMGISTMFLWESITIDRVLLLVTGAILFILSDTINAFNKFKEKIANERIYTMSTYLIGQFLLILGFLESIEI
ncbi:MAG: lysoplasmalogenase [Candidatus Heimdallarchaeota archaeon]|nr:lysoplasmalogenase [Candidatus Heimdallarchaeota archaeon]